MVGKANANLLLSTVVQALINFAFVITPHSSTFAARNRHVGASRSGSMHFNEFLA